MITLREDCSCVIKAWNAVSHIIQATRYAVFSDERKPEAEEKKKEYHCIYVLMKGKYVYKKLMDDVLGKFYGSFL